MTLSFPDVDMPITVEAAFGADPDADPAGWSFTALSTLLADDTISKREGREPGAKETDAKSCSFALLNSNGDLTPLYAASQYWPNITLDLPMRIKLNPTGTPTEWASGWATSWQPDFLAGSDGVKTSIVRIELAGIIQRLSQGAKPLRSALYRTMSGITPDDVSPLAYWPCEDGADSAQVASGLPNGSPMTVAGALSFAADSNLVGSEPLPTLAAGASLSATIPAYTDVGQWFINVAISVPSEPAAQTVLMHVATRGGSIAYWRLLLTPGSPSQLEWQAYDSTGTALTDVNEIIPLDGSGGGRPTEGEFYGHWFMLVLGSIQRTGTQVGGSGGITNTGSFVSVGGFQNNGTHSAIRSIQVTAGSGTAGFSIGHLGLFTDPAFAEFTGSNQNASAMLGHAGETAGRRVERLCREERVLLYTTGDLDDTVTMGPQTTETLLVNLRECETVGGILGEQGFGLHYITQGARYNQAVDLTIDLDTYRTTAGSEDQVVRPAYDNRLFRNQWTVDRPNGSTATVRVGTKAIYEDSATANVETDDQVPDQASWRAYRDSVDTLRWPGTPIDLGANPSLITSWLAVTPGLGRVKRTNLPDGHPPDAIDELVDGFSETLTRRSWTVTYSGSPAFIYDPAELDDDDTAKLDTAGCLLQAPATSGATSLTVATTVLPRWTTDAGEMPIPILVSGQVNSVTAIGSVSPSFVAAGTVAHGNNASVSPALPAGSQAGDLLLVWAAIRNSGTGTVNTPSGYTVLLESGNCKLLAKLHTGTESAPTITFTGGVANADTSAQMCAFRGVGITVHDYEVQLNSSAQDIAYPQLDISRDNCLIIYLGWKQDDWTSVATIAGATEIGEPDTTTGDDQGIVWDYVQQTTAARIASGSFTVTGGASAISRGAVIALATDVQTMTVTRGTNGVTKALSIRDQVNVYRPARLAL